MVIQKKEFLQATVIKETAYFQQEDAGSKTLLQQNSSSS